jgi:hypothetical protein
MKTSAAAEQLPASHGPGRRGAVSSAPPVTTLARVSRQVHSRWPEFATLLLYAALVAFAIPYHEPWADEAQAWQLARTLSLPALFQTYLRYEGSPGLWHFLLWVLIHLHVGYTGLHWVCGGIATGASALLVLKSPFPRYLKLLLPFTSFLLFQYAVVARSYVLAPLLLFFVALCWKKSPLLLALLLGLLANVALHAAVISAGLAVVYLIDQFRDGAARDSRRRSQLLPAALLLLGLWALALWTAWPPADLSAHASSVPVESRAFLLFAFLSLVSGIAEPWILSVPFWIAIVLWFAAFRKPHYLLPVLFFAAFSGKVHANWWHVGLLVPLVITLMWIAWPPPGAKVSEPDAIGRYALVGMAAMQLLWSGYAIGFDHYRAYSPDLAAAQFLRPFVRQGAPIAVTSCYDPGCDACRSVGILPYFDHDIYIDQPDPFWLWSTRNRTEELFDKVLPAHPAVVIVEMRTHDPDAPINPSDPRIQLLSRTGYSFTHMFCGTRPEGFRLAEKSCHLIFQRVDSSPEIPTTRSSAASAAK